MCGWASGIGALLVLAGCQSADVSRTLGARCTTASECDERCLPPDSAFPDGFCTVDCTRSVDCPDDAVCADREGGVCLFTCNFDEDCRFLGLGWTCKDTDTLDGGKENVCRG